LAEEFDKHTEVDQTPDQPPVSEEKPHRPGAELFEWLQMVMVCVLAAVVLFNCFARLTRVDGNSMTNTLQNGELMLVWSLGYQPQAGDIVVINKTSADFLDDRAIVKRVIAVGGQTVDIDYTTGTVYVDGEALDEPYIKETMYNTGISTMQGTHWEVPEGSVFVMGDNRNGSTDSRDDRLGTIDESYILGKVTFALWPFSKFGPL
jgi:signal peptidase I